MSASCLPPPGLQSEVSLRLVGLLWGRKVDAMQRRRLRECRYQPEIMDANQWIISIVPIAADPEFLEHV